MAIQKTWGGGLGPIKAMFTPNLPPILICSLSSPPTWVRHAKGKWGLEQAQGWVGEIPCVYAMEVRLWI